MPSVLLLQEDPSKRDLSKTFSSLEGSTCKVGLLFVDYSASNTAPALALVTNALY
jgi:hypothetical protein